MSAHLDGHDRARAARSRRGSRSGAPASSLTRAWWNRRQYVGGMAFVATTPADAAADIVRAAAAASGGEHVHLANAYTVALADRTPALLEQVFGDEAWMLPDGRPLSWVSALRRDRPRLRQVRGPQLFLDVCERGVETGLRHYLLGGTPEVLAHLEHSLRSRFPGISIVGTLSPPFREPTTRELAERDDAVRASGAQIVWVGLGTPKQDLEAARLARSLPITAIAVGAAFDYAAGDLREAPLWVRRIGMEWAFRLVAEPKRLWRRYLFGNARFVLAVARSSRR